MGQEKIYYCVGCGKEHKRGDFYKSYNAQHKNGVHPFCKDYIKNEVYQANGDINVDKFKNLLRQINAPFLIDEFDGALDDKRETIGTYFSRINMVQNRGLTWKDSIFKTEEDSESLPKQDEDDTCISEDALQDDTQNEIITTSEIKTFWGKGFSDDEYAYLENFFNDFISNYECDSPAQVLLFKNAAKTQLNADKALADGNLNLYDKLMKTLSTILGDSNIKPVQETGANATEQATFGTLIKKWENEKPIPEPLEEWEKQNWIEYMRIWFLSHLAKMTNIQNPFEDEYEKAMKEFRVETPSNNLEDGD